MKHLLSILALFFSLSAQAQWVEKSLTVSYYGLLIADHAQTLGGIKLAQEGLIHENNPFIGSVPTRRKVDIYFASLAVGTAFGLNLMPKEYRIGALLVLNAIEIRSVRKNARLGIHMTF